MPELPEIETVKLQLQKVLPGLTIESIENRGRRSLIGDSTLAEGKKVVGISRRAKVLIIELEDDISMAFHFKMTGQLIYTDGIKRIVGGHPTGDFVGALPSSHTKVIFKLSRGTLFFNDLRMFGWAKIGTTEEINNMKFLQNLGPEPFDINESEFVERVGKYKRPIKIVIMDQEVIAGVGNIYANDALWEARTDPRRLANTLTAKQYHDLYEGIIKVLNEGIKYGGATAANYVNIDGLGGHYQEHFRTYNREGEPCFRDQTPLTKISLGGRGTVFCHRCQT
jgi:formamidopyrimidine-DNA glycosylase